MENDGRVTVSELADIFNVSSGTIFTILNDHLKIRIVAARWIPRLLTENDEIEEFNFRRHFCGGIHMKKTSSTA